MNQGESNSVGGGEATIKTKKKDLSLGKLQHQLKEPNLSSSSSSPSCFSTDKEDRVGIKRRNKHKKKKSSLRREVDNDGGSRNKVSTRGSNRSCDDEIKKASVQ